MSLAPLSLSLSAILQRLKVTKRYVRVGFRSDGWAKAVACLRLPAKPDMRPFDASGSSVVQFLSRTPAAAVLRRFLVMAMAMEHLLVAQQVVPTLVDGYAVIDLQHVLITKG